MLDLTTERDASARIYVINLRGRLDSVTAGDFERFFESVLKSGHRFFIFDSTRLDFLSSAGISVLLKFLDRLDTLHGAAALLNLNEEIRLVLEFFGLEERMPSFDHLEEARNHLNRFALESAYPAYERAVRTAVEEHPGAQRFHAPFARDHALFEGRPVRVRQASHGSDQRWLNSRRTEEEIPFVEARDIPSRDAKSEKRSFAPGRSVQKGPETSPAKGESHTGSAHFLTADMPLQTPPPMESRTQSEPAPSAPQAPPPVQAGPDSEIRVVQCEQCGMHLRLYKSGRHMCPKCGIEFVAKRDGGASFYEKL